jgi:hypothetical protein
MGKREGDGDGELRGRVRDRGSTSSKEGREGERPMGLHSLFSSKVSHEVTGQVERAGHKVHKI